eukprot:7476946-Pyramimonas_sp.AAC.1
MYCARFASAMVVFARMAGSSSTCTSAASHPLTPSLTTRTLCWRFARARPLLSPRRTGVFPPPPALPPDAFRRSRDKLD